MTDFDFAGFIDDLGAERDFASEGAGKSAIVTTHVCIYCAGSGLRGTGLCYGCAGKGSLTLDGAAQRQRKAKNADASAVASKKMAATRATNQRLGREANQKHEDGALLRWCADNTDWNDFCASLLDQHSYGRVWSEKQVAALERMRAKTEATRAAKRKTVTQDSAVDLARIKEMFDAAVASGHKRPAYRAEGLTLSRAPDTGRNPGALYVKSGDDYLGKILDGQYRGQDSALEALRAIAADPSGAAMRWGQKTGTCSCCGRELTNAASIALGIGPICAQRWGL